MSSLIQLNQPKSSESFIHHRRFYAGHDTEPIRPPHAKRFFNGLTKRHLFDVASLRKFYPHPRGPFFCRENASKKRGPVSPLARPGADGAESRAVGLRPSARCGVFFSVVVVCSANPHVWAAVHVQCAIFEFSETNFSYGKKALLFT